MSGFRHMLSQGQMLIPQRLGHSRTFAVIATACMVVTACGSAADAPVIEASADQPALPTPPADGDGPQYGDTLEDRVGLEVEFKVAEAPDEPLDFEAPAEPDLAAEPVVSDDYPEGYELITWEDLIPPGYSNDEIYERYADRLDALEDGDPEADAIYAEMQAEYAAADVVNDELDGKNINLAGFVAPLNYEDDVITEFLLVPYFGACIHVPAPPSNQTILVTLDKADGLTIEESWDAIWVAGTLTTTSATTELATASYTISDAVSGVYDVYS